MNGQTPLGHSNLALVNGQFDLDSPSKPHLFITDCGMIL